MFSGVRRGEFSEANGFRGKGGRRGLWGAVLFCRGLGWHYCKLDGDGRGRKQKAGASANLTRFCFFLLRAMDFVSDSHAKANGTSLDGQDDERACP
jgi:hypothetical protein